MSKKKIQIACVRCTLTIKFDVNLTVVQLYMFLFREYFICEVTQKTKTKQNTDEKKNW